MIACCVAIVVALAWVAPRELTTIKTPHYVVKTDIATDEAREAALRVTKMADEYAARTRDFAGEIRTRFPLYLVTDREEYLRLGGIEGSAGLFNGKALVVHVPDRVNARVWHVLQHEGFHQFAHAVIGGDRPVWVNEGLAEYFGEALFTGDGFITGAIPQWRLERVRKELREREFKSIEQMMQMSLEEWNSNLSVINYDQGWSMVHFLIHGNGGKYRAPFGAFITKLSNGQSWQDAWGATFGDTRGFEQRWRDYWLALPDNPTERVYQRATVATLTSFLARATAQKQSFEDFEAFLQAARAGAIETNGDQWLPPALLLDAVKHVDEMTRKQGVRWSISSQRIICEPKSGKRVTGQFKLRGGDVISTSVDD